MYYDVVSSVYRNVDCKSRIDSHLRRGGFKTIKSARKFVDNCKKYDGYDKNGDYLLTEIEVHDEDGSLLEIV